MSDATQAEIAEIMAAERTWCVPINGRPITPRAAPQPQPEPIMDTTEHQENTASGMKTYWSKFTPEQRSKMILERRRVAEQNRSNGGKAMVKAAKALTVAAQTRASDVPIGGTPSFGGSSNANAAARMYLEAMAIELRNDLRVIERLIERCN